MSVIGLNRGAAEVRGERASILLLRDVPEERRVSMERFADELQDGFTGSDVFDVQGFAVNDRRLFGRVGLGPVDGYVTRFVRYPLAVRRRTADLYHIIDHGYADVARLLPPERTIVTCHDLMLLVAEDRLPQLRGRPRTVMRFRWTTSYLRRVARVVCVSATTQNDVVNLARVPRARTTVIPNGVNARFRPLDQTLSIDVRRALFGDGGYVVLHVGARAEYKNFSAALRVVAGLRAESVDVRLARVGSALSSDEVALAEQLGIRRAIIEFGTVSDERLVELYNASDALLFPSFYEGFGWPPLEAMACGTPVVTSNAGSLREVTGDAALSAEPSDIRGLVRLLRRVLEQRDLRAKLRTRGLQRAGAFTWQRALDGYARVYRDVLSGCRPGVAQAIVRAGSSA